MAFLGVYGSHTSGKTTNIMEWCKSLNNLSLDMTSIYADNSLMEYRYHNGIHTESRGNSWKCPAVNKVQFVRDYVADDTRLYVLESHRLETIVAQAVSEACVEYGGGAHIILITFDLNNMIVAMKKRCQKLGKVFRPESARLYEAYGRYVNRISDIHPVPYDLFQMDADYKEWVNVISLLNKLIVSDMYGE